MIRTAGWAPGSRANGSFPKGARQLSEKSPGAHPPPHQPSPGGSASATPPQGGSDCPGSAGVPPASCPFGRRRASVRCCRQPPCRREQQRPGRRRAVAPFPVDPSGGDGRGCARLGAGGTPALPGSRHCAGGTPALPGSRHCAGGTPALPGSRHRAGGTPALPGSRHRAGETPALPGSCHPMTSSHQGHKIAEVFWCRLSLKEVHLSSGLFVSIRGSSSLTIGRFSSNDPHSGAGASLITSHCLSGKAARQRVGIS